MRSAARLTFVLMLLAAPAGAQSIPVGSGQSVDAAALLQLLGPVIQSLGGSAGAPLDSLRLTSPVGGGDVTQFARLFESVGLDGDMTTLLSSLQSLNGLDVSSLAQLVSATGGAPAGPLPEGLGGLGALAGRSGTTGLTDAGVADVLSRLSGVPGLDLSSLSSSLAAGGASEPVPTLPRLAGSLTGTGRSTPGPAAGTAKPRPRAPTSAAPIRRSLVTINGRTLRKYSNLPPRPE